jgi:hypothetical protein
MNMKKFEGQIARWERTYKNATLLPNIVKAGNKNADTLSRRNCHEECTNCHKVDIRADIKQIRSISTLPAADWDPQVLRTERLYDQDIGPFLQEVEPGRRPDWKDIADRSAPYKSYWAQSKLLAVRNGVVERKWKSANGRSKVAQIGLPGSKVVDVLTELHGVQSAGHQGFKKT